LIENRTLPEPQLFVCPSHWMIKLVKIKMPRISWLLTLTADVIVQIVFPSNHTGECSLQRRRRASARFSSCCVSDLKAVRPYVWLLRHRPETVSNIWAV